MFFFINKSILYLTHNKIYPKIFLWVFLGISLKKLRGNALTQFKHPNNKLSFMKLEINTYEFYSEWLIIMLTCKTTFAVINLPAKLPKLAKMPEMIA